MSGRVKCPLISGHFVGVDIYLSQKVPIICDKIDPRFRGDDIVVCQKKYAVFLTSNL